MFTGDWWWFMVNNGEWLVMLSIGGRLWMLNHQYSLGVTTLSDLRFRAYSLYWVVTISGSWLNRTRLVAFSYFWLITDTGEWFKLDDELLKRFPYWHLVDGWWFWWYQPTSYIHSPCVPHRDDAVRVQLVQQMDRPVWSLDHASRTRTKERYGMIGK